MTEERERIPGKYSLRRTIARGNEERAMLAVSTFEAVAPGLNGLPIADENTEYMAALVSQLEYRMHWTISNNLRSVYAAFDQQDWDTLRVYEMFLLGPESRADVINLATSALSHCGHEKAYGVLTQRHLDLAKKRMSRLDQYITAIALAAEYKYGDSVSFDHIVAFLLERPHLESLDQLEEIDDLRSLNSPLSSGNL